jgi:hypothetical protein
MELVALESIIFKAPPLPQGTLKLQQVCIHMEAGCSENGQDRYAEELMPL